jgi:hypothetical protein
MQLYHRVPYAAYAWKIPAYGTQADEPPPPWLVKLMQSGTVTINALGGLSLRHVTGSSSCNPGDYIVYDDREQVAFYDADEFAKLFKKAS